MKHLVVLMGYLNPIERMGYELFAKSANNAGVDAISSSRSSS